ncbi:MAG: YciI family protein [Rhodobacteraceae bacterium]|nr:YciI family protein [Paracoccaceae bacterium]
MYYVLLCRDRPGALAIRKATRDSHLAYIRDTGVVTEAGPLLDADGEMAGSLVVLDVPDRAAAEAWAASDPYAKADLFADVEILTWKRVIGL